LIYLNNKYLSDSVHICHWNPVNLLETIHIYLVVFLACHWIELIN